MPLTAIELGEWLGKNPFSLGTLPMLISHGELLLISVAIAADTIGVLSVSKSGDSLKTWANVANIFILTSSSYLFAHIYFEASSLNPDNIALLSLVIFKATILIAGSCRVKAEE